MEVLYCTIHGGFGFSQRALLEIFKKHPELFPDIVTEKPDTPEEFLAKANGGYLQDDQGQIHDVSGYDLDFKILRSDRRIIDVVKEIGLEASSECYCDLGIDIIPEGYDYEIHEYDGLEAVYPVFPYKEVISDLVNHYRTGQSEFKSKLTQRVIDGEIDISKA